MMKAVYFLMLFSVLVKDTHSVVDWAAAIGAMSAASSAVISGSSMIHSMAGAPGYRVVCTIEIENWTKYPLLYPESSLSRGIMKNPPVAVLPGRKEAFVTHKTGYTATGAYGSASWLLSNASRRAVVMWSCPFNFDHFSNWLGVGLTESGTTSHHRDWTDKMYYRKTIPGLMKYKIGEYYYHTKTISVKDDKYEITGTMGTSHKAKAHIIVRPLDLNDLAPALKQAVTRRR